MTIERFVAVTATNHARTYGMYPQKGTIAVGSDADLAIWNPEKAVTISTKMLHDNVGYTPYEGKQITGWPEQVFSRGRLVVNHGTLQVERGSGKFIKRSTPEPVLRQRLTGNPNALTRKYFSVGPQEQPKS
jgi:dihydropyrimidinase